MTRLQSSLVYALLLVVGLWTQPAAAQERPDSTAVPDTARVATGVPADSVAAFPFTTDADSVAMAGAVPDSAFADLSLGEAPLTLDSLGMSAWERVWWGRRGVFRRTGLFPTHPGDPTADLRQVAAVRRRMLGAHQLVGLTTVGAMALTVVGGQIAYSTGDSGFHRRVIPVTIGLYSAGAALALLSPPKLYSGRSRRVDSIQVHRWLAVGHMAGMILTPLLAPTDGSGRGLHRALGYATFATFSAAMLTVTLLR